MRSWPMLQLIPIPESWKLNEQHMEDMRKLERAIMAGVGIPEDLIRNPNRCGKP